MGIPKAWLPMGDETVLQHLVHLLTEVVTQVVVVASPEQSLPALDSAVHLTHDRNPDRGPLEGLATGLSSLSVEKECAMVVACDVPLLKAAFVKHLFSSLGTHDAVVPFVGGKPHPLVAVYRTSVRAVVERQLSSGHRSMREFLAEIDVLYLGEQHVSEIDPQFESLRNINRPEDFRELAYELGIEVPAELRDEAE